MSLRMIFQNADVGCSLFLKRKWVAQCAWSLFCSLSFAATPMIEIFPESSSELYVSRAADTPYQIKYYVKNRALRGLSLVLQPLPVGIEQDTESPDSCLRGRLLNSDDTCTLNLNVTPAQLSAPTQTIIVPIILCVGSSTLTCYQTAPNNALHISFSDLATSVHVLALSVADTALNPALTGHARIITITNTSSSTVNNLDYTTAVALPSGTTVDFEGCEMLPPQASCSMTITPGSVASVPSNPSDPASIFSRLIIMGEHTTPVSVDVAVLGYGSVYQDGYVFSINDNTPTSESVGGVVMSLVDQAASWPNGIIWASNGAQQGSSVCPSGPYTNCTAYDAIPGIYYPAQSPDICDGQTDGACNTAQIIGYYPDVNPTYYAAGLCSGRIGHFEDWYLPAICEMGYAGRAPEPPENPSPCGSQETPLLQNIQSNLLDPNNAITQQIALGGSNPASPNPLYWSSTQYVQTGDTVSDVWYQTFSNPYVALTVPAYQTFDNKQDPTGVRCVRSLTSR